MFQPGDEVVWTSQAQGSEKTKIGKVFKYVPQGESAYSWMPLGIPRSRIHCDMRSQNDRYLVAVPTGKNQLIHYYAPRASALKKREDGK